MSKQWQALGNDRYRFTGRLAVWMRTFRTWHGEDKRDDPLPFPEYLTRLTIALAEQCRQEWQRTGDEEGLVLLRRRRVVVRAGRLDLGLFVLLDGLSARCRATALEDWQATVRSAAQGPGKG